MPEAVARQRMALLRALVENKQVKFRDRLNGKRLSLVTLKTDESQRRRRVTPALTDNFLHIEIDGNFAANQTLWGFVCHRKKNEESSSTAEWQIIPVSEGSIWNPMLYSSSEGAPSTTLEESHSTR